MRIDIGALTKELQSDPPYQITDADISNKKTITSSPVSIKGRN